jgi:hypothetical protein
MKGVSFYPQCNGSSGVVLFFCTEPENIVGHDIFILLLLFHITYISLSLFLSLLSWALLSMKLKQKIITLYKWLTEICIHCTKQTQKYMHLGKTELKHKYVRSVFLFHFSQLSDAVSVKRGILSAEGEESQNGGTFQSDPSTSLRKHTCNIRSTWNEFRNFRYNTKLSAGDDRCLF